ncbi:unnamed protein product, partial [marine sediment metagenome]
MFENWKHGDHVETPITLGDGTSEDQELVILDKEDPDFKIEFIEERLAFTKGGAILFQLNSAFAWFSTLLSINEGLGIRWWD